MEKLGQLYELNYEFDKAIHMYHKAIDRCSQELQPNLFSLICLHRHIVRIYLRVFKDYSQAIENQLKIRELYVKKYPLEPEKKDPSEIKHNIIEHIDSFVELADVYLESKDYKLTRQTLHDALILCGNEGPKSKYIRDKLKTISLH
ncbi:unnamed protein product [Adineta ricciae]|nr:unnamed protein product [Adineta ricciae]